MGNEIYNQLQDTVSSMIKLNVLTQERMVSAKNYLSEIHFSHEYQTVAYNPGRQCGKTMLIARNASRGDIVISTNSNMARDLQSKLNFFNPSYRTPTAFSVGDIRPDDIRLRGRSDFDIIWVDNASYIKDNDKYKLYQIFAGRCNHFVFLG